MEKRDEASWRAKVRAAVADDSPERTSKTEKKATKPRWDEQLTEPDKKAEQSKKKGVVGQLPSPSKQRDAAPAQLARAPISQKPQPTVQEWSGMAMAFQEPQMQPAPQVVKPLSVVAPQAEPAVAEAQPPATAQQAGPAFPQSPPLRPFQTLKEAEPRLAKTIEEEQAAKWAKAARKHTKVDKDEEFQKAVQEGAFKSGVGRQGLYKSYEVYWRRHKRCE